MEIYLSNKKIDNLQEKLEGKLPVTREELLVLVNSWGRQSYNKFEINSIEKKDCYDLSKLDTSEITDMSYIFYGVENFNGDISNWNTSNVTNMHGMFNEARSFKQPLNFDTSNVTDMSGMFYGANTFNQPIGNWNTSNVIDMSFMFDGAEAFNQDIGAWDVSRVTNMELIFCGAKKFNQDISNWDVSSVVNMDNMFVYTKAFEFKYNNGESLPKDTESIKAWLNNHREKTPEIINNKLDNNKNEFEQLIKEKNIPIDSKLYKELLSVYNQTQDKLKQDLEELKFKVVDIATKDFIDRNL